MRDGIGGIGMKRRVAFAIKRSIDVIGGGVLLLMTAPLLGLAMLAILLSSGRPVLYRGERWGKNERPFVCLKLRTMCVDQKARLEAAGLAEFGDDGRTLVFADDVRIDKVGRLLRKLSIDELPQLVNVIRGEMSLIGPRPLVPSMLEDHRDLSAARAVVRPGMSGLWQVRNRQSNISLLDMIDDDLDYIRNFSLMLDLRIALLTLPRLIEPAPAGESGARFT